MIASLTFTYGDNRKDIYKYKNNDLPDIAFRSVLDYNLYLFHNSSEQYILETKQNNFFKSANISTGAITGTYPQALKQALLLLKNKGVTKLVFLQDDVFTCSQNLNLYKNLSTFLKQTDLPYLNLEYPGIRDLPGPPYITEKEFSVYKADCQYFVTRNMWPFDDSPYFSTIDFALNVLYDETYFSYPDIWSAEWHLKAKFEANNIVKPITDKEFFRRVNFIGKHDWNKTNEINFLEENFGKK
jgi:hypothetical protein